MFPRILPLAVLALTTLPAAFADETPDRLEFTPAEIADWPQREFDGQVTYRLVEDDRPAVEAVAEDGATALYHEIEIDVSETPWLEWSWRVDELPQGEASEREKAGDDYGARIYVVQEGFFGKLSARALNYVWSRELAPGTIHGIAIMTDSDNTDSRSVARYGRIRLLSDE